jgi:hypothetical protein
MIGGSRYGFPAARTWDANKINLRDTGHVTGISNRRSGTRGRYPGCTSSVGGMRAVKRRDAIVTNFSSSAGPKSALTENGSSAPRGPSPRLVTGWFTGLFTTEALHVIPACAGRGVAVVIAVDGYLRKVHELASSGCGVAQKARSRALKVATAVRRRRSCGRRWQSFETTAGREDPPRVRALV